MRVLEGRRNLLPAVAPVLLMLLAGAPPPLVSEESASPPASDDFPHNVAPPQDTRVFDEIGSLPFGRSGIASAWVAPYAYFLGGVRQGGIRTDEILRVDPATREVRVMGARLPAPTYAGAAVAAGGDVFIFGGDGLGAADAIVRYRPSDDTAVVVGHLPAGRSHAAAVTDGSYAYVFGGMGAWNEVTRVHLGTFASERHGTLPEYRSHAAAVLAGRYAYLFAGAGCCANGWVHYRDILRYDLRDGSSQRMSSTFPVGLSAPAALWDGEVAYVLGGADEARVYSGIYRFEPSADRLENVGVSLNPPRYLAGSVWTGHSILLAGGVGGDGGALTQITRYRVWTLAALGDSVAAGHGLGSARWEGYNPWAYPGRLGERLGLRVVNFAYSGACSNRATGPESCKNALSVLHDQLPLLLSQTTSPQYVTLTVGANDVEFGRCIQVYMSNRRDESGRPTTNPCDDPWLTQNLNSLQNALGIIIQDLKHAWPTQPRILLTEYYSPFRHPTIGHSQISQLDCDVWIPAMLSRNPSMASQDHNSRSFRQSLFYMAAEGDAYAFNVLARLDQTISNAAQANGASTLDLRPDFEDHDMCRVHRDRNQEETWAYGMSFIDTFTSPFLPAHSYQSELLPFNCADPRYDSAMRTENLAPWWTASQFRMEIYPNCMPHPTYAGQDAIADVLSREWS